MAAFNTIFPVKPGMEDEGRAFAAETFGARREGFEAHMQRGGITRETWTLLQTPMGSFMLVWFEGDVEKAFGDLATDTEYTNWFRGRVLDLCGVDLGAPVEGPPPEVLLDYNP